MIIDTLLWTCVSVFALTAIITLLGIVGIVHIEKHYLNKLFTALILEIVSSGVYGFHAYVTKYANADNWNYIKITAPMHFSNNLHWDIDTAVTPRIFIAGVCKHSRDSDSVNISVSLKDRSVFVQKIAVPPGEIFNTSFPSSSIPPTVLPASGVVPASDMLHIYAALVDPKGEKIIGDTVAIPIQVK